MRFLREHILYKILALTLACAILIPTAVKFTHVFNHYKHEVCFGEKSTHLHKVDLNCKFYDFKLTQNFLVSHFLFNVFQPKQQHLKITSQYIFLSSFQQLHFSLRGPPSLI